METNLMLHKTRKYNDEEEPYRHSNATSYIERLFSASSLSPSLLRKINEDLGADQHPIDSKECKKKP